MIRLPQVPWHQSQARSRRAPVPRAPGARSACARLQPLFRELVLGVWRSEHERARELAAALSAKAADVQIRLDPLQEVFIFEKAIDRVTYDKQRGRLTRELTLADLLGGSRGQDRDA